jgi:hypothetical protein
MFHASNTFHVTCKECGATWPLHWPCQGTEEEIRFGEHQCGACIAAQYEREFDEANKDVPADCGRPTCPFNGQKHRHSKG